MTDQPLLDPARIEIKWGPYGTAPATALSDPGILPRVQDYRRQVSSQMYPLDKDDITRKIPNANFRVSRKLDGEFNVLVWRAGQIVSVNPGGTVRAGLPWMDSARELLEAAQVDEALIAGELHVYHADGRRERVHDVTSLARQPESAEDLDRLRFAAFDLISLDGVARTAGDLSNWLEVQRIFATGVSAHAVESIDAKTAAEIQQQFRKWVIDEGSEGLVVRSDSAGAFKIKPRHTLDAVVIGFTESADDRQGMMHDLLLAVARNDGALHVLCRVGGGFSEDQRRELLSDLSDLAADSEYAEVNSDHVAYQMVQPGVVIEISFLDLISQTTRGSSVNRMVLNWNETDGRYEVIRRLPLCSVISPQFIRIREDKSATPADIRINQVSDLVEIPMADKDATRMSLPTSQIMRREVYTKMLKGEQMVRKFLMWKTNKDQESEEFPAYVIHYTDFSPNRKNPLDRDIRVCNTEDQIVKHWEQLKEANIKKGWQLLTDKLDASQAVSTKVERPPVKAQPAKTVPPTDGQSEPPVSAAKTAKKKPASKKTTKTKAVKKASVKKAASAKKPAKKKASKKKAAKKKAAKKKSS